MRTLIAIGLLGAVLVACEGGPPPTPPAVGSSPTIPASATAEPRPLLATAPAAAPLPQTPTAPALLPATAPPSAPPATVPPGAAAPATRTVAAALPAAPPALATADRAARTPPAAPPTTPQTGADFSSGLMYLAAGDLTFYNADHGEPWRLVAAGGDPAVTAHIATFVLDPGGTRLAYLLVTQRTAGGTCQADSQLWLIDLKDVAPRRQLADKLLPRDCAGGAPARVVTGGLAFSPDGHQLAYLAAPDAAGPVALWTINSDPQAPLTPRRLFTPDAGLLLNPTWAPDARQIAFLEAADLGSSGSYDANVAVLPLAADGSAGPVAVLADGHDLPGGRLALPPFDLTWLDAHTLSFQSWHPAHGPDGAWLVDTARPDAVPRAIAPGQAGLGAWSAAPAGGPRYYAYRLPGTGLAVAAGLLGGGPGALLAALPEVGATGAVSPIWSADGGTVAFSPSAGRLLIADRAAPGVPATVAVPAVLRAAWSAVPGDPPLLAVIAPDGKTLSIVDRAGRRLAATLLAGAAGSPQALAWEPAAADPTTRRLIVRYVGGPQDRTPFFLLSYDLRRHTLTAQPGLPADDGAPLAWVALGPIREP